MILKVRKKNVGEISKTGIMIAVVLCTLLEKTQNSLKFLKVSVKKEYFVILIYIMTCKMT